MSDKGDKGIGGPVRLGREVGVQVAVYADDEGTAERRQHGPVEPLQAPTPKSARRPARTVDTLERLRREGVIRSAMYQAGRRFEAEFWSGRLDQLRAIDLQRGGGRMPGGTPEAVYAARDSVWAAIKAMGGITAPTTAVIWAVLGEGRSLRDWAGANGWGDQSMDPRVASGLLIGALGVLAAHYGLERLDSRGT